MAEVDEPIPAFLKEKIAFPDGQTYQLRRPLTNYRSCHDGEPQEARMVFFCRRIEPSDTEEEYVIKVKVQLPAPNNAVPHEGPSTTTAAELEALKIFRDAKTPFAPQLVAYHCEPQDDQGPLPGGFINYVVMTKFPGRSLFTRFWSMPPQERAEIVPRAVAALRSIYGLGVEPIDRGLRNVMWDAETRRCGIIDFELWRPVNGTFADETAELQRWGLLRAPPARDHFVAWQLMHR